MITFLQYLVPVSLLIYLLYHAKKSFAGIVALFFFPAFGANAYLNINYLGLKIKDIDVIFFSFILMWIVVRKIRSVRLVNLKINLSLMLATSIVLIFFVHLFIGIKTGLPSSIIPMAFRMEAYFGIGFFLWVDVLSRFHKDEIWNLFYILLVPTVFLSILYILSGIGLAVYPYQPYRTDYSSNQVIVRDFVTSPKFLFLSLIVILLRRKINFRWSIALTILIVALFFSYTRVYAIQFASILLLVSLWHLFRTKQRWMLAIQYSFFILAAIFFTSAFDLWNSARFTYFLSRFQEFLDFGVKTQNLDFRLYLLESAYKTLISNGSILWGYGMKDYANFDLGVLTPLMDSGLAFILFYFGIIGAIFYYLQMIVAGMNSWWLMWNMNIGRSRLGAYLFITIAISIIAVLNLSYMYDGAIGVIPLSLLYVEKLRQNNDRHLISTFP